MDQVVNEGLRMYPPVVSFISREVSQPMVIGKYTIPAGINVQVPVWQIHHDPKLWPNPEEFNPDRFAPGTPLPHKMAHIPFGAGPRACIGIRFGLLELKLTLARIFRRFRLVIECDKKDLFCTVVHFGI